MKYLRSCLLALCVCVLLLGAFSTSVSAKGVDVPKYYGIVTFYYEYNGTSYASSTVMQEFTPYNNVLERSVIFFPTVHTKNGTVPIKTVKTFHFMPSNDGDVLIPAGDNTTLTLKTLFYDAFAYNPDTNTRQNQWQGSYRLLLHYADDTMQYVDEVTKTNDDFTSTFTPKKNVVKIELIVQHSFVSNFNTFRVGTSLGEWHGDQAYTIEIEQTSEETGLLKNVMQWIKDIFNKLTDGFANLSNGITNVFNKLGEGFTNVVNGLIELPGKLWSLISDGLKNLFVPDEEFLVTYKDNLDNILEEKLGAVYQVVNILGDSWDRIKANDNTNTITIPSSKIDLPENSSFTFGGYTVPIVPEGFGFFADIIKTVVGIVCTILFFNGLRKKYDEVMGVEQ